MAPITAEGISNAHKTKTHIALDGLQKNLSLISSTLASLTTKLIKFCRC